jgi:uncharacterized RDD family membrane protein YckC
MGPFCGDCLVEINGRPYCATCKQEQLLDVRSGVDLTRLDLASRWRRFGALILDGLITGIPLLILTAIFIWTPMFQGQEIPFAWNFLSIPFTIAGFIYEGAMTQAKDGQTLGKMALKIRVVRMDGSSITPGQAWGRAAMRMVLGFCCALADYLPAFFTQEKTTLHDMAANTRVVNSY